MNYLRRTWNFIIFLSVVIERGIPIHRWPAAWRHVLRKQEQAMKHIFDELVRTDKVKRRIKDGEFVYYPIDYDED